MISHLHKLVCTSTSAPELDNGIPYRVIPIALAITVNYLAKEFYEGCTGTEYASVVHWHLEMESNLVC